MRRYFLDWRLWLCVAVAGAVFFLGYGMVTAHQESLAKDHRIAVVTAQNARLISQIEREHAEQASERRILLAGQDALNQKLNRVLQYLNTIGVFLPPEVIGDLPSHKSDGHKVTRHSSGGGSPKVSAPGKSGHKSSGGTSSGGGSKGGSGKSGSHGHKGGKSGSHSHGGKGKGHGKAKSHGSKGKGGKK